METRSVLDVLRTAGACIDVPGAHLKEGVVLPETDRLEGRFLRIRTSPMAPSGEGAIAVRFRGWWFYIDDSDPLSKQAFQFLRTLVGLRLYERGKEQAAPVLTIPVG